MIHDPASPDFVKLPRQQQAVILFSLGWDIAALMDEYGVTRETIRRWTEPEYKARRNASHSRYRKTEHGRAVANANARKRNAATPKAEQRYWANPEYRARAIAQKTAWRRARKEEAAHAL